MMASQMMIDESRFCSKSEVNGLSRESSSKGVACTHEDDTVANDVSDNFESRDCIDTIHPHQSG